MLDRHVQEGRLDAVRPSGAFYDVQSLRNGHVGRARRRDIRLRALLRVGEEDQRSIEADVAVHLLAHASGFVVQRWTLRSDRYRGAPPDGQVLRHLERGVWEGGDDFEWWFPDTDVPLRGNVRTAMNRLFLELHEAARGRQVAPLRLAAWAEEGAHGCERIHEVCRDNEISYPWPVTFGTQLELVAPAATADTAAEMAMSVAVGAREAARFEPVDIEAHADGIHWYWGENTAVVVRAEGTIDADLDCVDVDRTLLTEFLDLRRAALRAVQRDAQRILTEAIPVSRRRIDEWRLLLASATDDYVLHDRIGALLVPLTEHVRNDPHLRDLKALETQARANVESFQSRLDLAGQDASSIVGAIFAVVAAEPLAELTRRLAAGRVLPVDIGDQGSLMGDVFDIAFVVLAALTVWLVLRRSSNRLRGLRPDE